MNKDIISQMRQDFVPDIIKQAAESNGVTVAELIQAGSESYEEFIDLGMDKISSYISEDGMNKQAEMEKLSYMEKQALVGMLSALAAAAAIPFSAWSAYDLGKNVIGGAGDVLHGNIGGAAKRLPAMAFDTLGILPGVGVAKKLPKLFSFVNKARKAGTLSKVPNAFWQAGKATVRSKDIPGLVGAGKKLGQGRKLALSPSTWFKSPEELKAMKKIWTDKIKTIRNQRHVASGAIEGVLGKGTGGFKMIEGDKAYKKILTGKGPANDIIPAYDALHSPEGHKFYQWADPMDAVSMIRMSPLALTLGGLITNNKGLMDAGNKGTAALNYYGPDNSYSPAMARQAIKGGGYMAGYNYGN